MDSYRIIVTPDAKADITELRDYIANVLLSPKTARSYIQNLRKEIGKLSEMPTRIKLIDDEPWHSRGVRKFIVRNFLVYFRVEEDKNMNTIQDLYYGRISPYEMSISTAPEYQKLKALADKNEDLLRESLSDEQKELLDKLIESVTDISSISERDMFIAGFRLGMKLMIDVMKDE